MFKGTCKWIWMCPHLRSRLVYNCEITIWAENRTLSHTDCIMVFNLKTKKGFVATGYQGARPKVKCSVRKGGWTQERFKTLFQIKCKNKRPKIVENFH